MKERARALIDEFVTAWNTGALPPSLAVVDGAALARRYKLPAELFLESFDRHQIAIHDAARRKYAAGHCEPEGELLVILHRHDLR